MKHVYTLLLFCLSLHLPAQAQIETVSSKPLASLDVYVVDSMRNTYMVGANVKVVSGKDTLNLVTDSHGEAIFLRSLADSVEVTVNYLGYNTLTGWVKTPASVVARLTEKTYDITEIVVEGNLIAVFTQNDTTYYNVSAFTTMKGDDMSKLFKKMPGMEIKDGMLLYLGKQVDRITIDNQRLFGNNVVLALQNIRADDVTGIKVYEEDEDWAKLNEVKNAPRLTVVDVTTKSKPQMVRNITLSAAAGAETDKSVEGKRKILYDFSGKLVYSRVGETLTAEAQSSALRYNTRPTRGLFSYVRNKSNKFIIRTNNDFDYRRTFNEGWESRDYFPSDDYSARDYYSRHISKAEKKKFSSSNQFRYTFRNKGSVEISASFFYTQNLNRSTNTVTATQDGEQTQNQNISNHDKSWSPDFHGSISYFKVIGKSKIQLYNAFGVNISRNNGDGWRIDTLASSMSQIHLENNARGWERSYGWNAYVIIPLTATLSFRLSESASHVNSKSRRTAVDMLTMEIDPVNSYDYRILENNNDLKADIDYRDNQKQKGFASANAQIGWNYKDMLRDEHFPEEYEFPRSFNLLNVLALAEYKISGASRVNFKYHRYNGRISLTDLRDFLDDSNPAMLRAGNPDLKLPVVNSLDITSYFMKNPYSLGISVTYNIIENAIIDRPHYFTEDTYLPQYGYTATAGSTLYTKENHKGWRYLNVRTTYNVRSQKLKSNVVVELSYSNSRNPVYVNEELSMEKQNSYTISARLTGNFSSVFEPFIGSSSSYSNRFYGSQRDKSLLQRLDVGARVLIAGVVEVNTDNQFIWDFLWPEIKGVDRFHLTSNLSVGYRIGKEKRFTATIEGCNLFYKKQRITASTYADYIATGYERETGRYIMFRIGCKL